MAFLRNPNATRAKEVSEDIEDAIPVTVCVCAPRHGNKVLPRWLYRLLPHHFGLADGTHPYMPSTDQVMEVFRIRCAECE